MFPLSALGGMFGAGSGAWGPALQQAGQMAGAMGPYGMQKAGSIDPQTGQPWPATDQGGWGPALQQAGQLGVAMGPDGMQTPMPPDPAAVQQLQQQATAMGGQPAAGGWGPALQQAGQMGAAGLYGIQKPWGGGWASAYGGMGGGLSPLAPWLGSLMGRGITPWNRQF